MRGQLISNDVLGRDSQEARLRHAEEFVQMRGVTASHLEGPVDVTDPVGITVDEHVYRELLLVG